VVPGARLVKSLNHIGYHEIEEDARPFGAPDRRAVAVASDDPDAARLVSDVIDRLGFDAVPIGPLSRGVHVEPGTALFGARVTAPELHDALQLEPAARIAAA
jgi:hypothetical protein